MTRDELLEIALRYDTSMSRAMLKALGVEAPRRLHFKVVARVDKYEGIAECMAQRHGVVL